MGLVKSRCFFFLAVIAMNFIVKVCLITMYLGKKKNK